jgi:4-hydroxybenzoate polyprenyltransferase
MLKTASGRYIAFIGILSICVIVLMFIEPKMIVPVLIGLSLSCLVLYVICKIVFRKSEAEQKRIAVRNGKVAWVMVIVLLAVFFYAAAKHHNVSVVHFIRLWFGF